MAPQILMLCRICPFKGESGGKIVQRCGKPLGVLQDIPETRTTPKPTQPKRSFVRVAALTESQTQNEFCLFNYERIEFFGFIPVVMLSGIARTEGEQSFTRDGTRVVHQFYLGRSATALGVNVREAICYRRS